MFNFMKNNEKIKKKTFNLKNFSRYTTDMCAAIFVARYAKRLKRKKSCI